MITLDMLYMLVKTTLDQKGNINRVINWVLEARSMGLHLTPEAANYTLQLVAEMALKEK